MPPIAKPLLAPALALALALALAVLVAACVGGAEADRAARAWVGAPVDALLLTWGQPDLYRPLAEGGAVIEYRPTAPDDPCAVRFGVAADGLIATASGVGEGCGPGP